jgi:hypothetical protein
MPYRNPCRFCIHLAYTYSVGPLSVVWSELGPALPFPPMMVRALSLLCEVALTWCCNLFLKDNLRVGIHLTLYCPRGPQGLFSRRDVTIETWANNKFHSVLCSRWYWRFNLRVQEIWGPKLWGVTRIHGSIRKRRGHKKEKVSIPLFKKDQ